MVRMRAGGWTITAILLTTALLLAPAASAPAAPAKGRAPALRAAQAWQRAVRSAKTTKKLRTRNTRLAAYALRLFGAGRWCDGLSAAGRVKARGAVLKRRLALEAQVAKARLAKACQAATATVTATAGTTAGPYPAAPPLVGPDENEQGENLELPRGTFRPGTPKGAPIGQPDPAFPAAAGGRGLGAVAAAVTDPVQAWTVTDVGDSNWGGSVQDATEASAGDVVVLAVNRNFAWSKDGGKTFTYKDPTTIFPQPSGEGTICCDMVMHYSKAQDRFFWLLQYACSDGCDGAGSTTENRYRLAIASPAQVVSSGGTAWKYFDFTSKSFDAAKQWMDFPDMALGDDSLYFTFDFPRAGAAAWVRASASDLATKNSVGFRYYKKTGDYVLKTVQDTGTRGWIAKRRDAGSFELTHWDDGSTYVYHHTVSFPTSPTKNCSELGNDGQNFLAKFDCAGFSQRISGAAQQGNGDIWLGWTAGRRIDGQSTDLFPHSHIQLLTIDPSTLAVKRNRALWNPDYAFAFPALTANDANEVAMTYVSGGKNAGGYFNWGVGMVTNTESLRRVATGQAGASRIGDYYTVHPAYPSAKRFTAAGYVKSSDGHFHPYFALFGRSGDKPPALVTIPAGPLIPQVPKIVVVPLLPVTMSLKPTCPAAYTLPNIVSGTMTVGAALSPALAGATVKITYTRPGPQTTVHTVTTDAGGNASDTLALQRQDDLTPRKIDIAFEYAGDAGHTAASASCSVPFGTG